MATEQLRGDISAAGGVPHNTHRASGEADFDGVEQRDRADKPADPKAEALRHQYMCAVLSGLARSEVLGPGQWQEIATGVKDCAWTRERERAECLAESLVSVAKLIVDKALGLNK